MKKMLFVSILVALIATIPADSTFALWSSVKPRTTLSWSKIKVRPEDIAQAMKDIPTKVMMPVKCENCGETNEVYFLLIIE